MPRVEQVSRNEATSEIAALYDEWFGPGRDPVEEPGTATGTPGNWWTTWARTPDVLKALRSYPYRNAPVDPKLREIAIVRTGYARQSQFVFSQHCKSLRGLKVSEERIAAVPNWQVADCYDAKERAVLAYADCLVLQGGRTPEAVFDALRSFLDDVQILELTYITCLYDMHAVMSRALRLEFDDRDDPIVEVAPPEGFSARDFLDTGRR